jgi:HK97 family phage portal protein
MGLFRLNRTENRSVESLATILEGLRGTPIASGVHVDSDSAMRLSAVWSCVRLIVDVATSFPLDQFTKAGDGRKPVTPSSLVAAPSASVSPDVWRAQVLVSLLLRGNALGLIVARDSVGRATQIEITNPDDWTIRRRGRGIAPVEFSYLGTPIARNEVFHVPGLVAPGQVLGLSPIDYAREAVGLGLAAERYAGRFYAADAHPTAVLETEQAVDKDTAQVLKDRVLDALRGKREPLVLGNGVSWKAVQIAPVDSEFLDSQKFTVGQIARIFGVPPEMIGGAADGSSVTYANTEQRAKHFLDYCLTPWLVRVERAISAELPKPQFVKHNVDALLRSDTKTRFETHKIAIDSNLETLNEVRSLEDLPPVDGGDQPYVSMRERIDALGVLIRSGFEPDAACLAVGLDPIEHSGTIPVTVQPADALRSAPEGNE